MSGQTSMNPRRSRGRRYEILKQQVKELEKKNFSKLLLFHSGQDWYKMTSNSLLIFVNKIAPKLSGKPNILPDNDYTKTTFSEGYVSFHGIETIKKRLEKLDVLKDFRKTEDAAVFELNFSVSETEMKEFRRKLFDDQERAVSLLRPELSIEPKFYTKFRHILRRSFEATRKMPVYEREMFGKKILDLAEELVDIYLSINKSATSEVSGWKKIDEMIDSLMTKITIATELEVMDKNSALAIGEDLIELKKDLRRKL